MMKAKAILLGLMLCAITAVGHAQVTKVPKGSARIGIFGMCMPHPQAKFAFARKCADPVAAIPHGGAGCESGGCQDKQQDCGDSGFHGGVSLAWSEHYTTRGNPPDGIVHVCRKLIQRRQA